MNCPNCGGPIWDNAEKVAQGWNGPLRKCRDQECGWIVWPPKQKKQPVKALANGREPWTWAQLSITYQRSLVIAQKQVTAMATAHKLPVTVDNILAATATVFIAASRDGVKDPAKPAPAEPEPAPQDDDEPPY